MNNDADQKTKWREFWLLFHDQGAEYNFISNHEKVNLQNHVQVHVIEAAPAIAEIESLRAENAELQTKLSAANTQIDKLAEALERIALNDVFIASYQDEYHLSKKQAVEALAEYKKDGE